MDTYIRLTAAITPNSTERLSRIIDQKYRSGFRRVHLLLSTPGGSVAHGISLYNYLKGMDIELTTHNFGTVDSIGVIIFCAGSKRLSVPNARFFLHPIGMDILKPVRVDEHWIREQAASLKIDQTNIAKIIADTTDRDATSVESDIAERKSLLPMEAIEYNLVHEIETALIPADVDFTPIYESEAQSAPAPVTPSSPSSEDVAHTVVLPDSYSTYRNIGVS